MLTMNIIASTSFMITFSKVACRGLMNVKETVALPHERSRGAVQVHNKLILRKLLAEEV